LPVLRDIEMDEAAEQQSGREDGDSRMEGQRATIEREEIHN
jgi:hypothetical protein